MRFPSILLLITGLLLCVSQLHTQAARGEKLLEDREYEAALKAFSRPTDDPLEAIALKLGRAQIYGNRRYSGYDPKRAYRMVGELLDTYAELDEKSRNRLEKKVPLSDVRRVGLTIESQQLRALRDSTDPADYDRFLTDYDRISERRRQDVTQKRNDLAWRSIQANPQYASASELTRRYDLYEALPKSYHLADTLLNRFVRENGWANYAERFAPENAASPYVKAKLKSTADALIAARELGPTIRFTRQNANNYFGYYTYQRLPEQALVSEDAEALRAWLRIFPGTDPNYQSVFRRYVGLALAADPRPELLPELLAEGGDKISAETMADIRGEAKEKLRTTLLRTNALPPLLQALKTLDPGHQDEALQSHLLSLYQEGMGMEDGSKAYLAGREKSVVATEAESDLQGVISAREAEEAARRAEQAKQEAEEEARRAAELKARLARAEEKRKKEEELAANMSQKKAAYEARFAKQRAELEAMGGDRTGRQYASYPAWQRAQEERIATGKLPEPYRLPATVNSGFTEFKANETADGKYLYFTRNGTSEDIFRSEKLADGSWGEAVAVAGKSEPDVSESIQLVTTDGGEMLYFLSGQLYTAPRTADGWGEGVKLPEEINGTYWQADGWIGADNRTFFFVRYGLTGGTDIYVSRKDENGKWGEAQQLPAEINGGKFNRSPVLAGDLRTLYFTSTGLPGEGGADIYYSERLDDTYLKWSEPINLGPWINTSAEEWVFRLSPDGRRFFYTSRYAGGQDVFEVYIPQEVSPGAVVTIEGKVENRQGGGIGTIIVWRDLTTGEVIQETRSDPADGSWVATLPGYDAGVIGYRISKDGYYSTSGSIELDGQQKRIVLDQPLRVFTPRELKEEKISLPLENLFFATGSYELRPTSFPELDELAELLLREDLCLNITGHTDNVGQTDTNQRLSENRAAAVRDYLLGRGIATDCLTANGRGESEPVADNGTVTGRRRNRRVEVRFR